MDGGGAAVNWGTAANYADAPPMPILAQKNSQSHSPLGHCGSNVGSDSIVDGCVVGSDTGLMGGVGSASYIYLCGDDSGGGMR